MSVYLPEGSFSVTGSEISVTVFLRRWATVDGKLAKQSVIDFPAKGDKADLRSLAKSIVGRVEQEISQRVQSNSPAKQ